MSLAHLHYDDSCVVCKSFARLITKVVPPEKLQLIAAQSPGQEFLLEFEGQSWKGESAITKLQEIAPEICQCLWMLPPSYRSKNLFRAYRLGSWIRRHLLRRRDCNC